MDLDLQKLLKLSVSLIRASREILRYFPRHCGLCIRISASTSTLSFIALKNKIQSFGHFEISHPQPISSKEIDVILSDRFLIGWSEGGLHLAWQVKLWTRASLSKSASEKSKSGSSSHKNNKFLKKRLEIQVNQVHSRTIFRSIELFCLNGTP